MSSQYSKYDRAQDRIQELGVALVKFTQENPCPVGEQINVERGVVSYFAEKVPEISESISAVFGDVLQNLRSALDHLAYKLVQKFSPVNLLKPDGSPNRRIGFPICETSKDFETAIISQIPGLGKYAAFEMVRRTAAYKGGNNHLWVLHELNIIDKHRLLLTICVKPVARGLSPSERDRNIEKHGTVVGRHFNFVQQNILSPARPLKTGDVLHTLPISEAKEEMPFIFDIAISEPGIAEGYPLIILSRLLSMDVRMVIDQLNVLL